MKWMWGGTGGRGDGKTFKKPSNIRGAREHGSKGGSRESGTRSIGPTGSWMAICNGQIRSGPEQLRQRWSIAERPWMGCMPGGLRTMGVGRLSVEGNSWAILLKGPGNMRKRLIDWYGHGKRRGYRSAMKTCFFAGEEEGWGRTSSLPLVPENWRGCSLYAVDNPLSLDVLEASRTQIVSDTRSRNIGVYHVESWPHALSWNR
jgi:hypothetical protein